VEPVDVVKEEMRVASVEDGKEEANDNEIVVQESPVSEEKTSIVEPEPELTSEPELEPHSADSSTSLLEIPPIQMQTDECEVEHAPQSMDDTQENDPPRAQKIVEPLAVEPLALDVEKITLATAVDGIPSAQQAKKKKNRGKKGKK
jgi:hypothetical protein